VTSIRTGSTCTGTNPAATAFWRKAIRYPFQEHEQGTEIVQSFTAEDMDG